MCSVGIIGHFATFEEKNDGQTVKTKNIYEQLKQNSKYKIDIVDTQFCKRRMFKFLKQIHLIMKKDEYIILILSSKGAKILIPLLIMLNNIFKRKIAFCVVGSWFDLRVKNNRLLSSCAKKIDKIFVETTELKKALENLKFNNVQILYNFKLFDTKKIEVKQIKHNYFCTFSRVHKKKGIEDAIYAINKLNNEGHDLYLDVYGPITEEYKEEFYSILEQNKKCVSYKGNIESHLSREIVSNYEALLFPTHYIKEGLPGTLIDAYSSGTPVISSDWASAKEFVPDSVGFRYEFANKDELYKVMKKIVENRKLVDEKRDNCIKFAKTFTPSEAIKPLVSFLEK